MPIEMLVKRRDDDADYKAHCEAKLKLEAEEEEKKKLDEEKKNSPKAAIEAKVEDGEKKPDAKVAE